MLSEEEMMVYEKEALGVTERLLGKIADLKDVPIIGLVGQSEASTVGPIYKNQGYQVAVYDLIPTKFRALPRDNHPNSKGHELLLDAVWSLTLSHIEQTFAMQGR